MDEQRRAIAYSMEKNRRSGGRGLPERIRRKWVRWDRSQKRGGSLLSAAGQFRGPGVGIRTGIKGSLSPAQGKGPHRLKKKMIDQECAGVASLTIGKRGCSPPTGRGSQALILNKKGNAGMSPWGQKNTR